MSVQLFSDNVMKSGMIKFNEIDDLRKASQIGYDQNKMQEEGLLADARKNAEALAKEPGKGMNIDILA